MTVVGTPMSDPTIDAGYPESATEITKNRFVKLDDTAGKDNRTIVEAEANDNAWGIAREDSASGSTAPVPCQMPGGNVVAPVEAGGAIRSGQPINVGANGKAVTGGSGPDIGTAETSVTADGQMISIRFYGKPAS